jgi:hypothetical protein
MMSHEHFEVGDRAWVVGWYSHERESDGVVSRITSSGQVVLEDGRRYTPRGEGHGESSGTLLFPADRHGVLVGQIQDRLAAGGGLAALSVVQLEKISRLL